MINEYDDTKLCPDVYAKMAREYQNQTKNFEIKRLETNNSQKQIILQNIQSCLQTIFDCINFLQQKSLPKQQKQNAEKLAQTTTCFEAFNLKNSNNTQIKNYCQCLTICINNCCAVLKHIFKLNDFCTNKEFDIYHKTQNNILEIIDICSQMYGICHLRC